MKIFEAARSIKREKLSSKDSDGLPAHKFWNPLSFGWSSMWAFRRVNTSYEVKHVPPYSSSDPSYVPPKWTFIGQRLLVTAACYLVLDLLALRKPAVNNTGIFGPAQVPMISRIGRSHPHGNQKEGFYDNGFCDYFLLYCSRVAVISCHCCGGLGPVES